MDFAELRERRRRYRTMRRELREYSHHELTELGIARADIDRISFEAAYGRPAR